MSLLILPFIGIRYRGDSFLSVPGYGKALSRNPSEEVPGDRKDGDSQAVPVARGKELE